MRPSCQAWQQPQAAPRRPHPLRPWPWPFLQPLLLGRGQLLHAQRHATQACLLQLRRTTHPCPARQTAQHQHQPWYPWPPSALSSCRCTAASSCLLAAAAWKGAARYKAVGATRTIQALPLGCAQLIAIPADYSGATALFRASVDLWCIHRMCKPGCCAHARCATSQQLQRAEQASFEHIQIQMCSVYDRPCLAVAFIALCSCITLDSCIALNRCVRLCCRGLRLFQCRGFWRRCVLCLGCRSFWLACKQRAVLQLSACDAAGSYCTAARRPSTWSSGQLRLQEFELPDSIGHWARPSACKPTCQSHKHAKVKHCL